MTLQPNDIFCSLKYCKITEYSKMRHSKLKWQQNWQRHKKNPNRRTKEPNSTQKAKDWTIPNCERMCTKSVIIGLIVHLLNFPYSFPYIFTEPWFNLKLMVIPMSTRPANNHLWFPNFYFFLYLGSFVYNEFWFILPICNIFRHSETFIDYYKLTQRFCSA